jgi:hypothetical protein
MEFVKTVHGDKVSIVREIELYDKSKNIISDNENYPVTTIQI